MNPTSLWVILTEGWELMPGEMAFVVVLGSEDVDWETDCEQLVVGGSEYGKVASDDVVARISWRELFRDLLARI